jgi:SOS-response transcriptional repressor LexA
VKKRGWHPIGADGLSDPVRETYKWIAQYIAYHGKSPSYREIQKGRGYASLKSGVDHVRMLEREGYLTFVEWTPRSIRLTKKRLPEPVRELEPQGGWYSDR